MRGWCACIAKKIQGLEGTICDAPAKLQPRRTPARPPKPARKPPLSITFGECRIAPADEIKTNVLMELRPYLVKIRNTIIRPNIPIKGDPGLIFES